MPVPAAYSRFARLLALRDRLVELLARRPRTRTAKLATEALEDRVVPDGRPLALPVIYAGAGEDMLPTVKAYNAETGALNFERQAYEPGFRGGVRVAVGDFTQDGFPDVAVGPGPGGGPRVRVLDGKTGDQIPGPLGSFWAFDRAFTGGVHLAAGDVDGDGAPDLVAAAGPGGGPRVRVFSGATGGVVGDFFAYDADFRGGITVAAADLTGDGQAEIAVGAGVGGGPRVKVYDPTTWAPISGPLGSFFAFDPAFRGGVFVSSDSLAGDYDADGTPDLAIGSGPGMAGTVTVLSGATGDVLREFEPFGGGYTGGVRVALGYIDDDEFADLVTGTGPGVAASVRVFSGATGDQLSGPVGEYTPFGASTAGIYVAASNDPPPTQLPATLSGVASSSSVGSGMSFTVTITAVGGTLGGVGHTPTGTVTLTAVRSGDEATFSLGTVSLTTINAGTLTAAATTSAASLPDGAYVVNTDYSGDTYFFPVFVVDLPGTITVGGSPPPPPPPLPASIGDEVWYDTDHDGTRDHCEPGVAEVPVTLSGGGLGSPVNTTTDALGRYTFEGLAAGTYTVTFTGPSGATFTTPSPGYLSASVSAGQDYTAADAGFYDSRAAATVSVALSTDAAIVNQRVFFKAAVSGGSGTPTGTVTFSAEVGGEEVVLGSAELAGGEATVSTDRLPAGEYVLRAAYSGDGTYAPEGECSDLDVEDDPFGLDQVCGCVTCPVGSAEGAAPPPTAAASAAGVGYATGEARVAGPGVTAGGFGGTPLAAAWSWASGVVFRDDAVGSGAAGGVVPLLVPRNGDTSVALVCPADSTVRTFDIDTEGDYHERGDGGATLVYDAGDERYYATDGAGGAYEFYDFTSAAPAGREGQLVAMTDAAGNEVAVTGWSAAGLPTVVERTTGSGASLVAERLVTTYAASGADAGRVTAVTLERKFGTGSYAPVRSVEYAYHQTGSGAGPAGTLRTITEKDAGGAAIGTTYFRYATTGDSAGLMRFAFGQAAFERLVAAEGSAVDDLTDEEVEPYADKALTYDDEGRVETVTDAAAGCSVCAGGQGEFEYEYSENPDEGLRGPNVWAFKTVETLPDGNTNTVYTDAAGRVMLKVYTDTTTDDEWMWFTRYDAQGRAVLTAGPDGVTGFDEAYPDLVGYAGGEAEYLADDEGLFSFTDYADATTATSSVAGDAAGRVRGTAILHGELGDVVPQVGNTYLLRTVNGEELFFPAESTVYRNDDGTGGQTTTATYTWQGSTAQPASVTVTNPVVSTGQNGSGSATAATTVYDAFGRPAWQKDTGGFLTYTEYDTATGAVVKTIADVDTTQTTTFAGLPSGWSTPSGGGLHFTTSYEVDDRGRTTKVTYPGGRVDYTVYDDDAHEARYYPGWNSTSNAPTGPTVVTRVDLAGGYTESLTMSAAPAVLSGRPTGAESVTAVQSLSRSHVNDAGQVTHTDAYFDLGGLTYSTSATLGTEGVNFYRTRYAYDKQGRPNKVVTPAGTITRTVYDGLGRPVSEWVGTNDTPMTGFWNPTNAAGMVKVREYEYDGGGVGDGNLTRVTERPGLGAAARVTEMFYDWRGRAVASKAGVEVMESTDVNRPITYTDYDNLGQAVRTRLYDGDGVTVTSTDGVPNAPSASLLRAKSETSYDELGRVYRTDRFSVDPSSGSVGSYTLNSQTWYDARELVVKSTSPGGLVSKAAYDGLGRTTTSYLTDGGGDSAYADADDVAGDTVLTQTETTYDAAGNAILGVTRERFHDASGTGALGSPSSGVGARVSYAATYYDGANRPVASVNVGTNGGSAWTRPGSVPSRTDTVLVTSVEYAADAVQTVRLTGAPTGGTFTLTVGGQTTSGLAYDASAATVQAAVEGLSSVGSGNAVVTAATGGGWQVRFAGALGGAFQARLTASGASLTGGTSPGVVVATVSAGGDVGVVAATTDPAGRVARTYADALGRTVQAVEHFTDGAVTDTSNKTTLYAYGPAGMTSLTAALGGADGQTTAWVYGVTTVGGSGLDSYDLVGATRWPDPASGEATALEEETVTVNALGQTVTSTDRNETVHALSYDVLGRLTADAVTDIAGGGSSSGGWGVDGAVRRVETAYDGQGNPYLVTSYDAAGSGSVVNQVRRGYNGLGQLTAEWQAHAGAVNTSTTPAVTYTYSEMPGGANHSRLTAVTYPSGYSVAYSYASGLDATVSRLSALTDTSGTLEAYSYLGLGTVVLRSHPQPDLDLTYVKRALESDGDAGDQYIGLDRFGRVVDQRWVDGISGTATDRFQYGYDRVGNRLYRDNLVNGTFGEVYTYDGLNQLASFARGTLNGGKTAVMGTPAREQAWDYDAVGNWDGIDVDGTPETRSANTQNEITDIGSLTTPTYDANGNMTQAENGLRFVYDAWNRLVAVKNSAGTTVLEEFGYDGVSRRVTRDDGTAVTDLYYTAGWQMLEEQIGGDATQRYVWSPVYVDALILRDRDTDANGSLNERLWAVQDANWNVTAVVEGGGALQERYAYDPFGTADVRDSDLSADADGASDVSWAYLHQGLSYDAISGLYDNYSRWYSPTLGRFVSHDLLGFATGDSMLYRYIANNPVSMVDPGGLQELPPLPVRPSTTQCHRPPVYTPSEQDLRLGLGGGLRDLLNPPGPGRPGPAPPSIVIPGYIINQFNRAWADSHRALPNGSTGVYEQGGFIYYNPTTGEWRIHRLPGGSRRFIELPPAPPPEPGEVLHGHFHTHPHDPQDFAQTTTTFSPTDIDLFRTSEYGSVWFVKSGPCVFVLHLTNAKPPNYNKTELIRIYNDAKARATGSSLEKQEAGVRAAAEYAGMTFYKDCRDPNGATPCTAFSVR